MAEGERPGVLAMRWAGLALILVCVLVRATATHDPFPYWSLDPLQFAEPLTGIAPALSQALDVAVLIGAGLVLLAECAGGGILLVPAVLVLMGAAGAAVHAFVLRGWSLEDARIGGMWVSSMAAGLALLHACRHERPARVVAALAIGGTMLLAAKGVVQVFVEHPETVRAYEQNKAAFIAGQGWSPGSAAVRAYERRLRQPEAIGWFGLSNVFASFMAAGVVALAGWSVQAVRARQRTVLSEGWAGVLVLGMLAAGVGLAMSRSKGGMAAATLGLGMLVVIGMLGIPGLARRAGAFARGAASPRVLGWVALAAVALALLGVVARGLVGERIGDLSLLFRWFYMIAAARIIAADGLLGVGPAGFKDAYLLSKPPISPEEVSSPHSILFDYSATLGVLGVAWCAAFIVMVFLCGRGLSLRASPREDAIDAHDPGVRSRLEAWTCLLIAVVALAIGTTLEKAALTPEAALMRATGFLAWAGVTVAALSLMRVWPLWRIPAAAAAIALAVHGQIEVTPVWSGSSGLFLVLIGAAAGVGLGAGPTPAWLMTARAARGLTVPAGVLALGGAWAVLGLLPMVRWQSNLTDAAMEVRPIAQIRARLEAMHQGTADPEDSPEQVAADLARLAGRPMAGTPVEFDETMHRLITVRGRSAVDLLGRAAQRAPDHTPTFEALARLQLALAMSHSILGEAAERDAAAERAERIARDLAWRVPSAGAFSLLASIHIARHELDRQPEHLDRAVEALAKADKLDPYGLSIPVRLVQSYDRMGNGPAAAHWATIALERDLNQRLDPLRRLTDEERALIQRVLAPAKPGS